jgi:hypothetical protein
MTSKNPKLVTLVDHGTTEGSYVKSKMKAKPVAKIHKSGSSPAITANATIAGQSGTATRLEVDDDPSAEEAYAYFEACLADGADCFFDRRPITTCVLARWPRTLLALTRKNLDARWRNCFTNRDAVSSASSIGDGATST